MSTPGKTITATLREFDHARSGEQAEKLGSNRQEVISAWGDEFEKLSEKQQRAAIAKVRKRHPLAYPRTGRGNTGSNPSFAGSLGN